MSDSGDETVTGLARGLMLALSYAAIVSAANCGA